jgi:hypothetical protein
MLPIVASLAAAQGSGYLARRPVDDLRKLPVGGHFHLVYAGDQDLRVLSGRRGDRGSGSIPGTLRPDGGPAREDHIR